MDAIEKAIRNAFEKGDANDRAFREKVYRSAFAALERALKDNDITDPGLAERRRAALKAKVTEIETEFIPAVSPVDAPAENRLSGGGRPGEPVRPVAPDVGPPSRQEPGIEAGADSEDRQLAATREGVSGAEARSAPIARAVPEPFFQDSGDFDAVRPQRPEGGATEISTAGGPNVAPERRRPLVALFLGVTLLALAAMGLWWLISTGLIKIPDASEPYDVTQLPPDEEEFTPGEEGAPQRPGQADADRDWVVIFSPSDPTTLNAPGDTKAEVLTDDGVPFVRIRSGASGSAISFDVSQAVLEQISGKHAVFDIVARSGEGEETHFSLDCNFGELGDCGRKRYQAGYEKSDFLFDIDLPAESPGADGTIAVTSDVDSRGKALDVYEIKVSISP